MQRPDGNVLVVDALNLAFRWKHAGVFDFKDKFYETVVSLSHSYNCSKIIITADKYSSRYRKAIYPEYKANRAKLREDQSEKEAEDFKRFIEGYEKALQFLRELNYVVLQYDGVEADDLAAFVVKHRKSLGIDNIWLISSDRDWDLLIDEGVNRWSYVNRKEFTIENWDEHYEVPREHYIDYKCLTGDPGDNVPGVQGVGPKRAVQLINQFGGVFDIYDSLPLSGKYKYIQAVNDFGEQLLVNVELMDLVTYCEEAVGEDNARDALDRLQELFNAS